MAQQKTTGKTNFQAALSVYGKTILCAVMSLFVYFSVTAVFSGLTETVGQRIYPLDENGEYILDENGEPIYETEYFEDEDTATTTTTTTTTTTAGTTAAGTSEATAPTTTLPKSLTVPIKSELSTGAAWGMNLLIQALTGTIMVVLVYSYIWAIGDKDANMVAFGHRQEDKLRGLKIGCMAMIPAAVLYVAYVAVRIALPASAEVYTLLYCWLNAPYLPIVNAINTIASPVWETVLMACPLLVVPAVSWLAYALGYRQIAVSEKFLYVGGKKKKRK